MCRANAERLRWLTGFAGSAGIAVVLKDAAALFVDGRYTAQVKTQADGSVFEFRHVVDEPPSEWIALKLKRGDKLGYDLHLHTPDAVARFAAACEKAGAGLVAVDVNPIDAIWLDRPAAPLGAITPHKLRFAGENVSEKIARVRQAMKSSAGLMISDPHNLAWLFNIRGSDVSYTPLPLGFAYLPHEGRAVVFLDGRKLTAASRDSLNRQAEIKEPAGLLEFVEDLGRQGSRVAFDAGTAPAYLTQAMERAGGKADIGADPITLMKATKNRAGARRRPRRAGAGWRGHGALSRLACGRGAARPYHGNRRRQGSGDVSARERRDERHLVPDNRGRGPQFGDPALSGQRGLKPED